MFVCARDQAMYFFVTVCRATQGYGGRGRGGGGGGGWQVEGVTFFLENLLDQAALNP